MKSGVVFNYQAQDKTYSKWISCLLEKCLSVFSLAGIGQLKEFTFQALLFQLQVG